jgi:ParB family transcriptional regulator, chromosome partitioning protein
MEVSELPLGEIDVSAFNTRKDLSAGMEDSSIDDLAASIKEKGLLSPVMVRVASGGRYELVAGQRRLLACRKLGMRTISALVRSQMDDADATAISLIENVHRAEMNPIDKARAFAALRDNYAGDLHRVSRETGVGLPTVKRYLSLLSLPEEIQARLSTGEGPARIESLSTLTRTFQRPEDMIDAYNKTAGFTQEIQKQILKASGGDVSRIEELVLQAQEGAFDSTFCRGLEGKLMCEYIPQELAPRVVQMVEAWRRGSEPQVDVKQVAKKLKI